MFGQRAGDCPGELALRVLPCNGLAGAEVRGPELVLPLEESQEDLLPGLEVVVGRGPREGCELGDVLVLIGMTMTYPMCPDL